MPKPLIVIADDEPVILGHLVKLAETLDVDVRRALDGQAALDLVLRNRPALLVTDLSMPSLDGRQLLKRIRSTPRVQRTPVVIVTADSRRETLVELLDLGADDFILKPVDGEEFVVRLRRTLRHGVTVAALDEVTSQRDEAVTELARRNLELERLTMGLITSLERANAFNDTDTGNHIRRVCDYSRMLGIALGHDDAFCDQLHRYAGLHDVGKVGLSDQLLSSRERLDDQQRQEMTAHTVIGARLLASAGLPELARNIALHHHERWDGAGYPHGLGTTDIPIEARIVAVVDVYDALVTPRPWRPARNHDEASTRLRELGGQHLDQRVVAAFLDSSAQVLAIQGRYRDQPLRGSSWA